MIQRNFMTTIINIDTLFRSSPLQETRAGRNFNSLKTKHGMINTGYYTGTGTILDPVRISNAFFTESFIMLIH